MKRKELLGTIVFTLLVGTIIGSVSGFNSGLQAAYSATGTQNSLSEDWIETESANFSKYYLDDTNITDRLTGDWGSTNLTTTGSVNTADINFTSDIYYNADNRTDVLVYPYTGYDYVIFKTGSSYQMKNLTTGQIDDTSTSFESVMEWTWGNCSSGGKIYLYGPGETWTTSEINSQANKVSIISDSSLIIKLDDGEDTNLIEVTHEQVTLIGLVLDGNEANQADTDRDHQHVVEVTGSFFRMEKCNLSEGFTHGLLLTGSSKTDAWILDNYFYGNQANGLTVGSGWSRVHSHRNTITESSDVGLNYVGDEIDSVGNIVHHIDNSESPYGGNDNVGIMFEATSGGVGSEHSTSTGDIVHDCTVGISFYSNNATHAGELCTLTNPIVFDCTKGIKVSHYDNVLIGCPNVENIVQRGLDVDANAENVTLLGGTFKKIGTGANYYGMEIKGPHFYMGGGVRIMDSMTDDAIFVNAAVGATFDTGYIYGSADYGITLYLAHNSTIRNWSFWDTLDDAMKLSSSNNCTLDGNFVRDCVSALDISTNSNSTWVVGNDLRFNTDDVLTQGTGTIWTNNLDRLGGFHEASAPDV